MKMNANKSTTQSKKNERKIEIISFIHRFICYHLNRAEPSPEAEQRKKNKSDTCQLLERPPRIKSVIQKKDASSDTHKAQNIRRK